MGIGLSQEQADDLLGDRNCDVIEAFLEKVREYEATHQFVDEDELDGPLYFDDNDHASVRNFYGKVPFKFNKKGERVRWPGYDSKPPGLYEPYQHKKGIFWKVKIHYSNEIALVQDSSYRSLEDFVADCQKGRV